MKITFNIGPSEEYGGAIACTIADVVRDDYDEAAMLGPIIGLAIVGRMALDNARVQIDNWRLSERGRRETMRILSEAVDLLDRLPWFEKSRTFMHDPPDVGRTN